MTSIVRWLTLAALFLFCGCASISSQKQSNQFTDEFISAVDSAVPNNDKNISTNMQLDNAIYLQVNPKTPLSDSSKTFLSIDEKISSWEQTTLEKVGRSYSEFIDYLFGSLVSESPYILKSYEITYLSFNLALNHALMGRYDLASIEARKIAQRELAVELFNKKTYESLEEQEKFTADLGDEAHVISKIELIEDYPIEDFKSPKVKALKNAYQNASANYLSGFVFESQNDTSLAAPAYLKALDLNPQSTLFKKSLDDLNKKNTDDSKGEVLLIIQNDIAPQLGIKRFRFGVPTKRGWRSVNIALPIIMDDNSYQSGQSFVDIDGEKVGLEVTTDTDTLLRRYLKDSMPKYLSMATTKALIQIASQVTLSMGTKKLRKYDMGATELIGSIAIEKFISLGQPDTRTWKTLPRTVQMARVSLTKGQHSLTIGNASKSNKIMFFVDKNYQIVSVRNIGNKIYSRTESRDGALISNYYDSIMKKNVETSHWW